MAHYLRDERVTNLSINEDNLRQLNGVFSERVAAINANVPADEEGNKKAYLAYIIRFDNKGYRIFLLEDLLRYFQIAKKIERVLFTVDTGESIRSNRAIGTFFELRLDEKDSNNCFLTIASDNKDWVDASFSAVHDVLSKCEKRNGWARSTWTQFGVQIVGVILGFILSLWVATRVAPMLTIENSSLFAFLFVLFIYFSIWTYLNQRILWVLNAAFPNMRFYRPDKERLDWVMKAIVGGIVVAIVLYLLGIVFSFLWNVLSSFVRKSA